MLHTVNAAEYKQQEQPVPRIQQTHQQAHSHHVVVSFECCCEAFRLNGIEIPVHGRNIRPCVTVLMLLTEGVNLI